MKTLIKEKEVIFSAVSGLVYILRGEGLSTSSGAKVVRVN